MSKAVVSKAVDVSSVQRASMLRMGQTWYKTGKLNQAVDTFLRIVRENPGTREAEEAKNALLAIATGYENEGRYHMAIDIFDHLKEATA